MKRVIYIILLVTELKGDVMNRKVCLSIKKIDNLIFRRMFTNGYNNITPIQMAILKYLVTNRDKKIYQRDLERELDIRRSTLSGILNTMIKNDLILKDASSNDARCKEIKATKRCYDYYDEISIKMDELESLVCKGISEKELNIFFEVTDKIINNLKG